MNLKSLDGVMTMYKRRLVRKKCYKRLHHHKSDENIQKYKQTRRNTKKVMSEVKGQTYADLY
jgi:hypothetical protein